MAEHIPDSTTQTHLFQVRARARAVDQQRRSQRNQSEELDAEALKRQEAHRDAQLHKHSAAMLNNAEATIVSLLKNSVAFQSVIQKLAAWDPKTEAETLNRAEALLDEALTQLEQSPNTEPKLRGWARQQMASGSPLSKPKVNKKR